MNPFAAQQDTSAALLASEVRRTFGDVTAVDGVNLTIPRGQVVALLGPNGAGKTTFLDMMLGFIQPTGGTLSVLGGNPAKAVRQGQVGAVLQTGGLLDDLTVGETVRMVAACHPRHLPPQDVIDRAGITGIAARKVKKCSGGEQQRLRFALALLTEPEFLLLDEPTAGMDVRARREFWETMHAEAARGRTVLFATHYLQEASDFAERIVLMRSGQIVTDGTVEEVTRAGHRTVSCVWTATETPDRVAGRFGISDGLDQHNGRVRFTTEDTDALARTLLDGGLGRELEITSASLDDVFLDLTADHPAPAGTTAPQKGR